MRGASRAPLVLAGALVLGAFVFWAKVRLYQNLEYRLDLFGFLQMATAPLEGRLPLFENGWGRHAAIHNYFTVPLLLPVASLFGSAGLFAVIVAASLTAAVALAFLARGVPPERRRLVGLVGLAFLASPVALWIADDAPYGFHPDLLYLPLAIVFSVALLLGKRWAWSIGAVVALTREDGPLVALAVHVTVAWVRAGASGTASVRGRLAAVVRPALAWGAAFVCGIGILALQAAGEPGTSRAMGALQVLSALPARPEILTAFLRSAAVGLGLLCCGGIITLAGTSPRPIAVAALACLPLAGVQAIGGLATTYSTAAAVFFHGVSWAPRMASVWGVLAAALTAAAVSSPLLFQGPRRDVERLGVAALFLAFVLEAVILSECRFWSVTRRLDPARLASGEGLVAARLSEEEDAALRALARSLPPRTPIAATPALFARFDEHDLVWPDRAGVAWQPPVVVLCDTRGRTGDDRGCVSLLSRLQAEGWPRSYVGGIAVVACPSFATTAFEALNRGASRPAPAAKSAESGGTAETRRGNPKR